MLLVTKLMDILKIIVEINNENKGAIIKYEEIWNNIKYLNAAKTNGLDDCDDKYMKIRFHWNDNLPLKKNQKCMEY